MIRIAHLADHEEVIPALARWFRAQWPDYFASRTQAQIEQGFYAEAGRRTLPVRLVAFVDDTLAGTVVLRAQAVEALPEYSPGLGGLFVAEPYRRCGVGSQLIQAGMDAARELGCDTLYAGTETAQGILERLGWELVTWKVIATVPDGEERLALYQCRLLAR